MLEAALGKVAIVRIANTTAPKNEADSATTSREYISVAATALDDPGVNSMCCLEFTTSLKFNACPTPSSL
jgi:hypothetical protein